MGGEALNIRWIVENWTGRVLFGAPQVLMLTFEHENKYENMFSDERYLSFVS